MRLLHPEERAFLDAYVYEATHGPPFRGPATTDLQQRGIRYHDLSWLLTAYQRELSEAGEVPCGVANPAPPPSPWKNLEQARLRDQELQRVLQSRKPDSSTPAPQGAPTVATMPTNEPRNDGE
jgi:hypothetical protein